jgi:hypothetical protein
MDRSQKKNSNGYKHLKICSAFLAIKEMQIKTTLKFLLTHPRENGNHQEKNNKCWKGCAENF